ncbi:gas vesicle protein GvpJ [Natrinema halophilum]|uniref:Gas vesicle protein n=1 Tax=Natrinema halophilum TaxID=1699371 RepID=A0A7D5K555_9EURY|nr:gas vesicle protein [Natrinema halophilum]QLG48083.1 gas vesicle protein [Natrinema halophilum]
MVNDFQPSRQKADLAEVVEMLLDKGIVINADIAVSIGDTQLLGVQVRAAIASFETAAKYGLEFPEGTDMRRVAEAVGDPELAEMDRPNPVIAPTRGVNVTADEEDAGGEESPDSSGRDGDSGESDESDLAVGDEDRVSEHLGTRPDPERPTTGGFDLLGDDSDGDSSDSESNDDDAESSDEESEPDETSPDTEGAES